MRKLLTIGDPKEFAGEIDFIRERVDVDGDLWAKPPAWWTGDDTRAARAGSGIGVGAIYLMHFDGCCNICPASLFYCGRCYTCRTCLDWESENGKKGTCGDTAYEGARKRKTPHHHTCPQYRSFWWTFDELNRLLSRVPIERVRHAAAAARAGAEGPATDEEFAEFCATVRRLEEQGIVTIPRKSDVRSQKFRNGEVPNEP